MMKTMYLVLCGDYLLTPLGNTEDTFRIGPLFDEEDEAEQYAEWQRTQTILPVYIDKLDLYDNASEAIMNYVQIEAHQG